MDHFGMFSLAVVLVILNGFFVAAEFAYVKARLDQLERWQAEKRLFAGTAVWLARRLDESLSVCQLGITIASLALGWVGEPALASMLEPLLSSLGLESERVLHGVSFVLAFGAITSAHLVLGEQVPKIFAIRKAEQTALWVAAPLQFFYITLFPFMWSLNKCTLVILRFMGVSSQDGHESPHTEAELRVLLRRSYHSGELTGSEHRLIHRVFEFDDLVCRRVMVPRPDVAFFDIADDVDACLEKARQTRHTRYPVCKGSLSDVMGFVHIKDFVNARSTEEIKIESFLRPPQFVPETTPVSELLRMFQESHQLLAFVLDEYGDVVGIVTLENVLEPIVGSVEDEFDVEAVEVVEESPGTFLILGKTDVADVRRQLGISFDAVGVDTFSGYLTSVTGTLPDVGQQIEIPGATVEVLKVGRRRATHLRVVLRNDQAPGHQES